MAILQFGFFHNHPLIKISKFIKTIQERIQAHQLLHRLVLPTLKNNCLFPVKKDLEYEFHQLVKVEHWLEWRATIMTAVHLFYKVKFIVQTIVCFLCDRSVYLALGVETTKTSSTSYKTFSLVRDSEYFKSKVLVDSVNGDNEPIEQITAIHIRGFLFNLNRTTQETKETSFNILSLDRHLNPLFIEVFKRVFPLQEQLHTAKYKKPMKNRDENWPSLIFQLFLRRTQCTNNPWFSRVMSSV